MHRHLFPLFIVVMSACASESPPPPKTPSVPTEIAVRSSSEVTVNLGNVRLTVPNPLSGLDFIPRYDDRRRLPSVRISRLRRTVPLLKGRRMRYRLFLLAVTLWRQALRLEASLGPRPYEPTARTKWEKQWQRIRAMKDEAIFHLEYLAGLERPSPAVLEHLAYYVAPEKPARAAAILKKLMSDPRVSKPEVYRLDLASLYIQTGSVEEALSLLRDSHDTSSPRAVYIAAAARLWKSIFSSDGSFVRWCYSLPERFRTTQKAWDLVARAALYFNPPGNVLHNCLSSSEAVNYVTGAVRLFQERLNVSGRETIKDLSRHNLLKLFNKLRLFAAPCVGVKNSTWKITVRFDGRVRGTPSCTARLVSHISADPSPGQTVIIEVQPEVQAEDTQL